MAKREVITAARLRKILSYNPETGVLTWLIPMGANVASLLAAWRAPLMAMDI